MLAYNDAESNGIPATECWPDSPTPELDDVRWTVGPEIDCGLGLEDWAAYLEDRAVLAAREHLDLSRTLTMREMVARQRDFYAEWDSDLGPLIARYLDNLVADIDATSATTPQELEGRLEVLDRDLSEADDIVHEGSDHRWCSCLRCTMNRTDHFVSR